MKSNRPVTRVKVLFHTQPRFATLTNMVASIALRIALGIALSISLGIAFWASTSALGGDWPQLLGPNRDGNAADELPAKLGDLKARWEHKVGAGFAGPAIVDGKVLVFHRTDDEVIIECLNAKTGKQQWEYRDATKYSGGYNSDNGPRCVPVVADGRVYAFGSDAELHCVRLDSGAKVWKRRLSVDYRSPDGYFGAGATPVVVGDRVFVCLGGRKGSAVVALNSKTGETLWTKGDDRVSYASPVVAKIAGKTQVLFLSRRRLFSLDPQSGDELWAESFGKEGLTVTACSPLVFGDQVFITASYNIGAKMLDVQSGKPSVTWGDDETLSSQYTNVVHSKGFLYGTHGREDAGLAEFRCVDAATGKVKWSETGFGVSHVILAGDRLLIQRVQEGELVLAEASPEGFKALDRFQLTSDQLRASPALADGALFIRTHNRRDEGTLVCLPLPK